MREYILLTVYALGAFLSPIGFAAIAEYSLTGSAAPFTGGSVSHYVRTHRQ